MKGHFRIVILLAISILIPAMAQAGPVVKFERTDYDFGAVEEGKQLRYDFKFSNAGDADLVVTAISSS